MPKMKECLISINLANKLNQLVCAMKLKIAKRDIGLRCPRCHKPVRPHQAGGRPGAHFEHLKRNAKCPLSDV